MIWKVSQHCGASWRLSQGRVRTMFPASARGARGKRRGHVRLRTSWTWIHASCQHRRLSTFRDIHWATQFTNFLIKEKWYKKKNLGKSRKHIAETAQTNDSALHFAKGTWNFTTQMLSSLNKWIRPEAWLFNFLLKAPGSVLRLLVVGTSSHLFRNGWAWNGWVTWYSSAEGYGLFGAW